MKVFYPNPQVVSVWIGNFKSEAEFDSCVDGPITKALGIKTELASVCEVTYETEAVPIRQLFEGFSDWESFIYAIEEVANKRNLKMANAALVCYFVKCEDAPAIWDKMQFLGSFKCDQPN